MSSALSELVRRRGAGLAALAGLLALLCWTVPAQADEALDDEAEVIAAALEPMTGDLDAIVERRILRLAIPYNPIFVNYDGSKFIGVSVEVAREFESFLEKELGSRIDVMLLPLPRDAILTAVVEGRADIAAANLTITEARAELIAYSNPVYTGIDELVVTGPGAGAVASFDDLVESGLYLRQSSSYAEHLAAFNAEREAAGKPAIPLEAAEPYLEDHDILDMVNAGLVPATVVDSHKLDLWTQVYGDIVVHSDLALNKNGATAWALRKDSTALMEVANRFLAQVKKGTLIGNVLIQRYLQSPDWLKAARGDARTEAKGLTEIIKNYAGRYGFDWKMIFAQAYQESRLDQSLRSAAGAVGIMQLLPTTAADASVGIPDISDPENNIHAGIRYLRHLRDHYFDEAAVDPLDRALFALGAYNAGPGNIAKARAYAEKTGLDPNVWFSNVEVAVARTIGQEPVIYVRNIYKHFATFVLIDRQLAAN